MFGFFESQIKKLVRLFFHELSAEFVCKRVFHKLYKIMIGGLYDKDSSGDFSGLKRSLTVERFDIMGKYDSPRIDVYK